MLVSAITARFMKLSSLYVRAVNWVIVWFTCLSTVWKLKQGLVTLFRLCECVLISLTRCRLVLCRLVKLILFGLSLVLCSMCSSSTVFVALRFTRWSVLNA